jgi:hypothetical protein
MGWGLLTVGGAGGGNDWIGLLTGDAIGGAIGVTGSGLVDGGVDVMGVVKGVSRGIADGLGLLVTEEGSRTWSRVRIKMLLRAIAPAMIAALIKMALLSFMVFEMN